MNHLLKLLRQARVASARLMHRPPHFTCPSMHPEMNLIDELNSMLSSILHSSAILGSVLGTNLVFTFKMKVSCVVCFFGIGFGNESTSTSAFLVNHEIVILIIE